MPRRLRMPKCLRHNEARIKSGDGKLKGFLILTLLAFSTTQAACESSQAKCSDPSTIAVVKHIAAMKKSIGLAVSPEVLAKLPEKEYAYLEQLESSAEILDIVTTDQQSRSAECSASLRMGGQPYVGRFTYKVELTDAGKLLVTAYGL